ncbi:MAG: hypothetical protein MUF45_00290 [Spirosomaceae bacterium]|jgi:copper chaperone CopZ|nr:hypothetical protein [Spirosomataceae bacterium]
MENQTFKTNINCGGCVARVTNTLNETVGNGNWEVETTNPDKVLTIKQSNIQADKIIEAVKKVGFNIEVFN